MRKTIPVQDEDHLEVTVSHKRGEEAVDLWFGPVRDGGHWPANYDAWVTLSPGEAVLLAEALLRGARKAAG